MGHNISGVLLKGNFDAKIAVAFDLQFVSVGFDITLFWLNIHYTEYWSKKLNVPGILEAPDQVDEIRLLFPSERVVAHMMALITATSTPLYAIIVTDYFGGIGTQAAALYKGETLITDDEHAFDYGSINQVLRGLGVKATRGLDEFDTIGLSNYRSIPYDFLEVIEKYPECSD
ncbi:hypothetical protein NIES4071_102720 (plasmid) [Calothrix sp. NIES-4071]|nr:hypothetical protein NIES4071_102720 [Calothrix sp. NIES-4071]BAZ64653.1 hypothetical protein NIES4105_103860 [Calothrix sp. NIES-4105]